MEAVMMVVHCINSIFSIVNPILMCVAVILWIVLYNKTSNKLIKINTRQWCLERQINYIANNKDIDKGYIDFMKKIYDEMMDKE